MKKSQLKQIIKEELIESLPPLHFLSMMDKRKKNRRNKMNQLGIK